MSNPARSLNKGLSILKKAGQDEARLGMALISLHSALEKYLRQELSYNVPPHEQESIRNIGHLDLVNAWQSRFGLSRDERNMILGTNSLRNKVAHDSDEPYTLSRDEIEAYAQFVTAFMGVETSLWARLVDWLTGWLRLVGQAVPFNRKRFLLRTMMVVLVIATGLYLWFVNAGAAQKPESDVPANGTGIDRLIEVMEAQTDEDGPPGVEETATAVPTPTIPPPTSTSGRPQIQVDKGSSHIRTGPGLDYDIMDVAPNGQIYAVLETSADGSWFKIEISPGREGWIGSSRVQRLP